MDNRQENRPNTTQRQDQQWQGPVTPLRPASEFKNPYVNKSKEYNSRRDGPLCIACGECGHVKTNCRNPWLEKWERAYLVRILYPDSGNTVTANLVEIMNETERITDLHQASPLPTPRPDTKENAVSIQAPSKNTCMSLSQYAGKYKNATVENETTSKQDSNIGSLGMEDDLVYRVDDEEGESSGEDNNLNVFMAARTKKRQRVEGS